MIVMLCLRWWYSAGWQWVWRRMLIDRLVWVSGVFSTQDLLKTLFAPYRQTFAGQARGSIGDQFKAFADRSISRVIGAVVRLVLIFASLLGFTVVAIVAALILFVWPILPILPLVGICLMFLKVGV